MTRPTSSVAEQPLRKRQVPCSIQGSGSTVEGNLVADRPILFSAPMVRAILDGRKAQTRRLMKPQPPTVEAVVARAGIDFGFGDKGTPGLFRVYGPVWAVRELTGMADPSWPCPYGAPGDQLWVRETWGLSKGNGHRVIYRADLGTDRWPDAVAVTSESRWSPSIHMPRRHSRIDLEVTGVRVERLQSISDEDARREGVDQAPGHRGYPSGRAARVPSYRAGFEALWDAINGKRATWASNPWVWVIEFRRVAAEERAA